MDYKEMMSRAPQGCQPKVMTSQSRLEDWARHLGKKVEDLTESEKEAERQNWERVCNNPCDWMGS